MVVIGRKPDSLEVFASTLRSRLHNFNGFYWFSNFKDKYGMQDNQPKKKTVENQTIFDVT